MVDKSQLELMVVYQDIELMINEAEEEQTSAGFNVEGMTNLEKALDDLSETITQQNLRMYYRLKKKFNRPIVPVRKDICLGCFAKQPNSYRAKAVSDQTIMTCEQCGRILFLIGY